MLIPMESSNARIEGSTLDMSLNGMLVQTEGSFPASTRVGVTVQLKPGAKPFQASGKVARLIGDDCMGIELANVSMEESERLQEFLLPLILTSVEVPETKK